MKKVIWGTGYNAAKFFYSFGKDEIAFFIDSNLKKNGEFLGKRILHPTDIENWQELYIYVPHNFYSEITEILKAKGLKQGVNFTKYDDKLRVKADYAEHNLESALKVMEEISVCNKQKTLFLCIHLLTKKSYMDYVNQLMKYSSDMLVISEAYWLSANMLRDEFGIDTLITPCFWDHYTVINDGNLDITDIQEISKKKPYVYESAMQIHDIFPDILFESCFFQACLIEKYICAMLKHLQPKRIICYDSVSPSHHMLHHICQESKVSIIFTHPGIIPGTLAFDTTGELGASLPATERDRFLALPVCDTDLEFASYVWEYLYKSELNRKIQPKNDCISYIKTKCKQDRPVLFLAGQNDALSNMIPYRDYVRQFCSPVFQSSWESMLYFAKLCEKNNWNLVYKPHPMYTHLEKRKDLPSNVIFVEFGDVNRIIDFADVTITIVSTINYIALIRHKPVVMLGYTQTRGKGCTYEAFEKNKIEETIKEALNNGFMQEQHEAFLKHIAQCLKYYLYDDLQERPIRYGRPVPTSIDDFYELENLLRGDIAK